MYEARQNKEKVSRRIDGGSSMTRQRVIMETNKNMQKSFSKSNINGIMQRLVIRARDAKEILFNFFDKTKGTIYNSAKSVAKRTDFTEDKHKEIIGIGQINSINRKLDENETLIIVSHGSKPTNNNEPIFAQRSALDLAEIVKQITTQDYKGNIYLDGCYTGRQNPLHNNGSSYIEKFDTKRITSGYIKGNVGAASTDSNGTEWISISRMDLNQQTIPANILLKGICNGYYFQQEDDKNSIMNMYDIFEKDSNWSSLRLYIKEPYGTAICQNGQYQSASYIPLE